MATGKAAQPLKLSSTPGTVTQPGPTAFTSNPVIPKDSGLQTIPGWTPWKPPTTSTPTSGPPTVAPREPDRPQMTGKPQQTGGKAPDTPSSPSPAPSAAPSVVPPSMAGLETATAAAPTPAAPMPEMAGVMGAEGGITDLGGVGAIRQGLGRRIYPMDSAVVAGLGKRVY